MSKYAQRGPYHFIDYADCNSQYHAHVEDLCDQILRATGDLKGQFGPLTVHEVGCGEGLILHKLSGWMGMRRLAEFTGNDIDPLALQMAEDLLHPAIRVASTRPSRPFDVVLFCDSLEHIETWKDHIEWAQRAQCVVIAVPSQHDRHAVNEFAADSFDQWFGPEWKLVHRRTREARHLSIWVRPHVLPFPEHVDKVIREGLVGLESDD
jgi:SAM-dependent methyltransferase